MWVEGGWEGGRVGGWEGCGYYGQEGRIPSTALQGYLAHKKMQPPQGHHMPSGL